MVYHVELDLLENRPIFLSLTNVYGIGQKTSLIICKRMGFSKALTPENLYESQLNELTREVSRFSKGISRNLKKDKFLSFERLVSIKSFKGLRRYKGLPVRGQRTHTNAKTARKKP